MTVALKSRCWRKRASRPVKDAIRSLSRCDTISRCNSTRTSPVQEIPLDVRAHTVRLTCTQTMPTPLAKLVCNRFELGAFHLLTFSVISHFTCRSLTVGSWRRIGQNAMDLVVFYSPDKACMTY